MKLRNLLFAAAATLGMALPAAPAALAKTGPLPVRMEVDPGLTHHVLFRPAVLPNAKLPVVIFAGGGCRNAGARFSQLLGELASHGYFIIALGDIGDPVKDVDPAHEPEYNGRPTKTDVTQIDWAAGWARKANGRKGGRFAGRLDLDHMALMGQSCGGVQSLDAAARLKGIATLVVLNSGLFSNDREMGGSSIKRADLPKITMPTMILLGGKGDIAYENGQANFDLMTGAPIFLGSADYGHRATYFEKDGGLYGTVVLDWLNWRLKGNAASAKRFVGEDCGLCRDAKWSVRRRGI